MVKLLSGQSYLWQWNSGQRLVVDHAPGTVFVFAASGNQGIARKAFSEGNSTYVSIPNVLLQTVGTLNVYAHRVDADRLTTVLEAAFPIREQPQPPGYINNEDETLIWLQLEEQCRQYKVLAQEAAADARASAARSEQVLATKLDKAAVDDSRISSENLWSAVQIDELVRKTRQATVMQLTPKLHQKAAAVHGRLIEESPMHIIQHLDIVQEGSGDPGPSNIRNFMPWNRVKTTRCGTNVFLADAAHNIQKSGLTFSADGSGTYQISGRNNASGKVSGPMFAKSTSRNFVKAGVTYHVYAFASLAGVQLAVEGTDCDGKFAGYAYLNASGTSRDFTPKKDGTVNIFPTVDAGANCDVSIQVSISIADANSFTPYVGDLCEEQFPEPVAAGSWDLTAGVVNPAYKLICLRVADMNNSEDYPGWKNTGICDVVGKNYNGAIVGVKSNIGWNISCNTSSGVDTIFISRAGFTQTQLKEKYSDLTVQVAAPYRKDLVPSIQVTPHTVLALGDTTTVYGNAGDVEVVGCAEPNAVINALEQRMAALERAAVQVK